MRHLRCEKENNPEERNLEEGEKMLKAGGPRACELCGNYYTPTSLNQRYCSCQCRTAARQEYCKEYHARAKVKKAMQAIKINDLTWPEINKICNRYQVSYGQAMARGLLTRKVLEAEK